MKILLLLSVFLSVSFIHAQTATTPTTSLATKALDECIAKNKDKIQGGANYRLEMIKKYCKRSFNKINKKISKSNEVTLLTKKLSDHLAEMIKETPDREFISTSTGATKVPTATPTTKAAELKTGTTDETTSAVNTKDTYENCLEFDDAEHCNKKFLSTAAGASQQKVEPIAQLNPIEAKVTRNAYEVCLVSPTNISADYCDNKFPELAAAYKRKQDQFKINPKAADPKVVKNAYELCLVSPTNISADYCDKKFPELAAAYKKKQTEITPPAEITGDTEELDVIHTNQIECENPEWMPSIDKKIIGIDGASCSPSQAGKRISACIRFVKCTKRSTAAGIADSSFIRQALCAPSECGDGQVDECLQSDHAIYQDPTDATRKSNLKTGRSLIEDKAQYKIKMK